jgi:hypothetical protein
MEVVTGGWLDGGNFASGATWAWSRGRLGEDSLNKWVLSVSNGDMERKAGRCKGKMAQTRFNLISVFSF